MAPLARACLPHRQARSLSQRIAVYEYRGKSPKALLPHARAYPGSRKPYFLM